MRRKPDHPSDCRCTRCDERRAFWANNPAPPSTAELERRIEQLETELAAETERLDLLEELGLSTTDFADEVTPVIHSWPYRGKPGETGKWTLHYVSSEFPSLRAVLDAAISRRKVSR